MEITKKDLENAFRYWSTDIKMHPEKYIKNVDELPKDHAVGRAEFFYKILSKAKEDK